MCRVILFSDNIDVALCISGFLWMWSVVFLLQHQLLKLPRAQQGLEVPELCSAKPCIPQGCG